MDNNEPLLPFYCEYCGGEFSAKKSHAKTCSDKCRTKKSKLKNYFLLETFQTKTELRIFLDKYRKGTKIKDWLIVEYKKDSEPMNYKVYIHKECESRNLLELAGIKLLELLRSANTNLIDHPLPKKD